MILAPCLVGAIKGAVFLAQSETLGPGSYTRYAPIGATQLRIRLRGGGGGGGDGPNAFQDAGGGAGGYSERTYTLQVSDFSVPVNITVGAGGAVETAGGNTTLSASFSTAISMAANGGQPGIDETGGAGGTASGGTTNTTGDPGSDAQIEFPPDWTQGSPGSPNGGEPLSAGGAGSAILDWT